MTSRRKSKFMRDEWKHDLEEGSRLLPTLNDILTPAFIEFLPVDHVTTFIKANGGIRACAARYTQNDDA